MTELAQPVHNFVNKARGTGFSMQEEYLPAGYVRRDLKINLSNFNHLEFPLRHCTCPQVQIALFRNM